LLLREGTTMTNEDQDAGSPIPSVELAAEANPPPPEAPEPEVHDPVELIAPTRIQLQSDHEAKPGRPKAVMATVTSEALWIQDTWSLRKYSWTALESIELLRKGKDLVMTFLTAAGPECLKVTFAYADEGYSWERLIRSQPRQLAPGLSLDLRPAPEGVALVKSVPDVPYMALGWVDFTDRNAWMADRGLQLRAGQRGADAIISLERRKCSDLGWGARRVSGKAIRVEDAEARKRLRLRWYGEEVGRVVNHIALLLVVLAALFFLIGVFAAGRTRFHPATGETSSEALASTGLGMGIAFGWPLVMLALLRVLRWPQLLRILGLAALVAFSLRSLAIWVALLVAAANMSVPLKGMHLWVLADPGDWALVIAGVITFVRCWRLADAARQILPEGVRAGLEGHTAWSRAFLGLTVIYALGFLGFAGTASYQIHTHMLQPGVDPKREQEALLAMNEGFALAEKSDLVAAERAWQHSLKIWEELTARRPAPALYQANLARVTYCLGWLHHRQGRMDLAERFYERSLAIASELKGEVAGDPDFTQVVAEVRAALTELRSPDRAKPPDDKLLTQLEEKNKTAGRKYEEASVKAAQGDFQAEKLFTEAIALWEEILPHATNAEYRKDALALLTSAHLQVGDLQQQQGKRTEAGASFEKAIAYGEKIVALDPDRPRPKHNLEVARRALDNLREQIFQHEIDELCRTERYADAAEASLRGLEKLEEEARVSKDREAARKRLAHRSDRFAWFLAHCPDSRVRNARAAVKRAVRATELQPDDPDYWFTRAVVEYRAGQYRESLASLERVKTKEGGVEGSSWFLVAMNRQQLKQSAEARAAFRKAVDWFEEQQRKAEDNAVLRFQFELNRPLLESLKREAESLIEGKGAATQGVG
jgi:tetratricopeptide (TPR) repeat protein